MNDAKPRWPRFACPLLKPPGLAPWARGDEGATADVCHEGRAPAGSASSAAVSC